MQIDIRDFDPTEHEKFKCLSVRQPYADLLTSPIMKNADGRWISAKTIEVRSRNTAYRGDVLICSTAQPVLYGRLCGYVCGFVEIVGAKPVEEFTAADWAATCIPVQKRPSRGYGWLIANPRRVVEFPVTGKQGFFMAAFPKGEILEYPREIILGKDGWEKIMADI